MQAGIEGQIQEVNKGSVDQKSRLTNDQKQQKKKCQQRDTSQQKGQDEQLPHNLLTPANPIIDKYKSPDEQINMKLIDWERQFISKRIKQMKSSITKSKSLKQSFEKPIEIMTLFNGYDLTNLLYRKHNNSQYNQLNKKKYFSSIFFPIYLRENNKFELSMQMPHFEGMVNNLLNKNQQSDSLISNLQDELEFNSNFQSGNLFAVFKTGTYTYDLVLQNDLNTTGCTQWFYFSVKNKKNSNVMAKFNIVNLYKAESLYNQGMKPIVLSSLSGKGWRKKGQNIFYQKNSILKQGSTNKFYSSLSFSYDFTKGNDTVEFAHALPYTYSRLMQLIKTLESSQKCVVKSLGITPLKKSIPIIKFESEESRLQKKAIIFMTRQHPGQTQGSYAIQQILLNFIKSSTQIDFLLWRFNVYIIPMVNVDGVILGNYRCNALGHDLNRNWEGQEKSKHPQIVYIKKEIKKIMAKHQIQLILDLHGHSNKMNSFFYGNPYGPNPFVFPYIASKTSPFISFQDCTFTVQRKQKAKTARSVLGNLIKQSGYVYTYEMSFYGGIKNGKVYSFNEQQIRNLGKDLVSSIYKVYVEIYKQQKTQKESLYLKEIRKQVLKIQGQFAQNHFSGSDSEAQQQRDEMQQERKQEIQQKLKQLIQQKSNISSRSQLQTLTKSDQLDQSFNVSLIKMSQHKNYPSCDSSPITQRLKRNNSLNPSHLQSFIINRDQNLQQKIKRHKLYVDKLKVFGQNYFPKSLPNDGNQELKVSSAQDKSTIKATSMFQDRSKELMRMNFIIKTRNKKSKQKNYSTLQPSKSEWKDDDLLMNDIVRVNRLQYKKIERQKDKLIMQRSLDRKNSNYGVFKLPSIVKNFKI